MSRLPPATRRCTASQGSPPADRGIPQRGGDRRQHLLGRGGRLQRHVDDRARPLAGEPLRGGQRQPRLAHPTGSREAEQTAVGGLQERGHLLELRLAPHEAGGGHGQALVSVGGIDRGAAGRRHPLGGATLLTRSGRGRRARGRRLGRRGGRRQRLLVGQHGVGGGLHAQLALEPRGELAVGARGRRRPAPPRQRPHVVAHRLLVEGVGLEQPPRQLGRLVLVLGTEVAEPAQRERAPARVELLALHVQPAVELVAGVAADVAQERALVGRERCLHVAARQRLVEGRHVGGHLPPELVLRGFHARRERQRVESLQQSPEVLPRGGGIGVGPEQERHAFAAHPAAGVGEVTEELITLVGRERHLADPRHRRRTTREPHEPHLRARGHVNES